MQSASPVQLTQVPPRPTCSPSLFSGPDCQGRWNIYNEALLQRTREELRLREERPPSPQGPGFLAYQKAEIQADAITALQATFDSADAVRQAEVVAHTEGLQQGAGIGVGASLLLFGLIFGIRRLMTSPFKKAQARAASA